MQPCYVYKSAITHSFAPVVSLPVTALTTSSPFFFISVFFFFFSVFFSFSFFLPSISSFGWPHGQLTSRVCNKHALSVLHLFAYLGSKQTRFSLARFCICYFQIYSHRFMYQLLRILAAISASQQAGFERNSSPEHTINRNRRLLMACTRQGA